jgi:hypothetical protein
MIRILPAGAACGALLLGACGGPQEKAAEARADHVEQIGEQQADALEKAAKATDAQQSTFEKQADAVEDNAEARADEIRKAAK